MSLWNVTSLDCASDIPGMDIAAVTAILPSSDLAEIIRIVATPHSLFGLKSVEIDNAFVSIGSST
jgi:hypothetical protein